MYSVVYFSDLAIPNDCTDFQQHVTPQHIPRNSQPKETTDLIYLSHSGAQSTEYSSSFTRSPSISPSGFLGSLGHSLVPGFPPLIAASLAFSLLVPSSIVSSPSPPHLPHPGLSPSEKGSGCRFPQ